MIPYLITGIILGFWAGVSPGPLLALVVSETLRHSPKAGIKVAVVPILTDLPIILLTLFILAKLSRFQSILGAISILGGFFILYLGYESLRTCGAAIGLENSPEKSLQKGMMVNLLNPQPYLFWFTVGAPTAVKAYEQGVFAAISFIGGFYLLLVGSKIAVAVIAGKSRSFLTGAVYVYTMRCLGLALFIFAGFLFYDGIKSLMSS